HDRRLARIVDELPTVLDVAGVQLDPAARSDGADLAPTARTVAPAHAYSETFLPRDQFGWSELMAVRTERLKYIEAPRPELYDLREDPSERTNVWADRKADASGLVRALDGMARAPSPPGATTAPNAIVAEQLMSLGYLG